jgi:uncharacterized membrane protein YcaP (DUF421 family)
MIPDFLFLILSIPEMNPVVRGLAIYLFLLLVLRIMGKRSLAESTTFDLVLLLIISEVTQEALVGEDSSLTGAFILIVTLVTVDMIFSQLKEMFPFFGKVAEGASLIVVDRGKPLEDRMRKCKVTDEDILEAARENFGLERMEQIRYAILEKDGSISIVPEKKT